ncbi:MAG: PAM68 family protein [Leptolyngbyaceae cyanobacterium]
MPADSENNRLPFEPKRKRKKSQTDNASSAAAAKAETVTASEAQPKSNQPRRYTREETSIPEVVSQRMLRRMLLFAGIPIVLGVLVFFASYVLIVQGIAELPNVVVLLTTLGCFGLSVVGLSYGALSASWEEETKGSTFGFDEFQVNFGRLVDSWRYAREEQRNRS